MSAHRIVTNGAPPRALWLWTTRATPSAPPPDSPAISTFRSTRAASRMSSANSAMGKAESFPRVTQCQETLRLRLQLLAVVSEGDVHILQKLGVIEGFDNEGDVEGPGGHEQHG